MSLFEAERTTALPALAIVIVAYRSRDELDDCLGSLPLRLGDRSVEIVVIDNSGNSDGSGEFVRGKYPYVDYVVPAENLGFGRANNLGYMRTSAECVLFLNPDTIMDVAALAHCVTRVVTEPSIGLITPRLVMADGEMDLACRRSIPNLWDGFCRASGLAARFSRRAFFAGYNLTHLDPRGTYEVGAINGAFMLGRREVLERVAERGADSRAQIFDERFFMYGDDLDLCIRVSHAGYKIIYEGHLAITHLKGLSVAKNYTAMSIAIFDANRDVYLKHFNPKGSRLIEWKWRMAFGAWKQLASLRARLRGYRQVRPL
jgi:N-acetylglucosaminyl-diphospho-decaprenol L-rhamnosyltransferase